MLNTLQSELANAIGKAYLSASEREDFELMDKLLQYPNLGLFDKQAKYIKVPDHYFLNALESAAAKGQVKVVAKLLETVTFDAPVYQLALTTACFNGKNEVVSLLLSTGKVKPNSAALREALCGRQTSTAKILFDVGFQDNTDFSQCLTIAAHYGFEEIFDLILKDGRFKINSGYSFRRNYIVSDVQIGALNTRVPPKIAHKIIDSGLFTLTSNDLFQAISDNNNIFAKKILHSTKFSQQDLETAMERAIQGHHANFEILGEILLLEPATAVYLKKSHPHIYHAHIKALSAAGVVLAKHHIPRDVATYIASYIPGFKTAKFLRRGFEIGKGNCPASTWSDYCNLGSTFMLNKFLNFGVKPTQIPDIDYDKIEDMAIAACKVSAPRV